MIRKRICTIHGLYNIAEGESGCPTCKKYSTKKYDKDYRNQENDKFYHSRKWKRVRGLQLYKHPLCFMCQNPATIADHIVEIEDGGAKLSLSNLQSFCTSCHNTKTAEQKKLRGGGIKSLQSPQPHTESTHIFSQKPIWRGGLDD